MKHKKTIKNRKTEMIKNREPDRKMIGPKSERLIYKETNRRAGIQAKGQVTGKKKIL